MTSAFVLAPEGVQAMSRNSDLDDDQRERFSRITAIYDQAKGNTHRFFQVFKDRMNFYIGKHYGNLPSNRNLVNVDPRLAFEIWNICRPTINATVQQRMERFPMPEVRPATKDPWAKKRAKTTEAILRSIRRVGPLKTRTHWNMTASAEIHGWAWAKTYWNPWLGKHNPNQPRHLPPFMGDTGVEYVSPLDVYMDPWATCIEEARFFFHRKLVPVGKLKQMYPRDINGEPTFFGQAQDMDDRWPADNAVRYHGQHSDHYLAEVVECHWLPDMEYRHGFMYLWSGQTVIADLRGQVDPRTGDPSANLPPYECPFTLISGSNKHPDNPYPDGKLDDLLPLQITTNRVASFFKENIAWTANPFVLVPTQAGVRQGAFVNVAGQRVDYQFPYKPEIVQPNAISPSALQFMDLLRSTWNLLSGQSEESRGLVQSSNTPAKRVAFQKELVDKANQADNEMYEDEFMEVHRKRFQTLRDYAEDGRMLRIIGEDKRPDLMRLQRDDVEWDLDILISTTSDKPTSFIARFDMALEAKAQGFFADDPEAKRARNYVQMDIDLTEGEELEDVARAEAEEEELAFLLEGAHPIVGLGEIYEVHLDTHQKFMNTRAFRTLPQDAQLVFAMHVQETQDKLFGPGGIQEGFAQQTATLGGAMGAGPSGSAPPEADPGLEGRPPSDGGHSAFPDQISDEQSVDQAGDQVSG